MIMKRALGLILAVALLEGCATPSTPVPVSIPQSASPMAMIDPRLLPPINLSQSINNAIIPNVTNQPTIWYDHIFSFNVGYYDGPDTNDRVVVCVSTNLKTWLVVTNYSMNPKNWTNGGKVVFHYPSPAKYLFFKTYFTF